MQRPNRAMRRVMKNYGTKFVECHRDVWVFQLANGMKVILRQDNTTDSVVINRVVAVGSCNEPRGFLGGSHYFEHLNFAVDFGIYGASFGTSYDEIGQVIGAENNATTSRHGTAYYIKVAKAFLELALATDCQRVRGLKLNEKAMQSEMNVILNEMEQGKDNPAKVLFNKMYQHVYRKHPVRKMPIGNRKDVSNMTIKRLQWFYDKFYWPNNMTLIVVGNIDLVNVLELINRHYGPIASSPKPIPVVDVIEPKQMQERRFVVRKVGDLTRVMIGFRIPKAEDFDTPKLWVIEDLLGSSSGRLRKALVDTSKAVSAFANVVLGRDNGLFLVGATVAEDQSADEVILIILAELEKLATGPITKQELETVRKGAKAFDKKMWADAQTWAVGFIGSTVQYADWKLAADNLKNYLSVTAKQIRQVTQYYFQAENRTVGIYVPTKKKARQNVVVAQGNAAVVLPDKACIATVEELSPEGKFENLMELIDCYNDAACKPEICVAGKVVTSILDNGLSLATMQKPAHGTVALSVSIRYAGHAYASADQRQMPMFVADMLIAGTSELTKNEIRQKLSRLGANLQVSCGEMHVNLSASVGLAELPELMQLLQSLLRNPIFPQEELDLIKMRIASSLKVVMNSSGHMARIGLFGKLYTAESPLHPAPFLQIANELQKSESADLVHFHKSHYIPQCTRIAIVGDISHEEALKLLDDNFGDWQRVRAPVLEPPLVVAEPFAADNNSVECHLPGKENTRVLFGHVIELSRQSDDYFAAVLSNAYLGGDTFSGLLGKAVRGTGEASQENKGITYGIYSSFEGTTFGRPTWVIQADVNPAHVEDLYERVRTVLIRYKEMGIKPHELARLKMARIWAYVQSLDSPIALAGKLSKPGFNPAAIDNVPQKIQAVTVEQIHEFNQKNIKPDQLVLAIAGDLSVEQQFA